MARFSASSNNLSDLFPPWHNYHSSSNYFSLFNRFLMADCAFYDRACKVKVLESCCATLSPQTVSTDVQRKGEGSGEGGGRSLENGPGLRPVLPWPSNCARILMTCVYSMWAQMADRFRSLLCFFCYYFLLVTKQPGIAVSYYKKKRQQKRTHSLFCGQRLHKQFTASPSSSFVD